MSHKKHSNNPYEILKKTDKPKNPDDDTDRLEEELDQEIDDIDEMEEDIGVAKKQPRSKGVLSDEVEALQEELQASKEKLIRAHAEMENIRRRATQDIEKAHKYGTEQFVKELLPVVDSLEKALEIGVQAEPALHEGVELTYKMFMKALEKHGVKVIDPESEPFDPHKHEAMSMQPNPDVEPNTVLQVIQKGYKINGRLVRPAMVIVSQ